MKKKKKEWVRRWVSLSQRKYLSSDDTGEEREFEV